MSKLVRSLALMTALAALSAGTVSVAQDKGKTPATKAAKKADGNKVGSIEYYKNDKGKWRYVIKDENDKTIAMPLAQISYDSKEDCLKAIDTVKKILTEVKPTERAAK
jgi:uncharacterized protein YegP (UPF0339 family)